MPVARSAALYPSQELGRVGSSSSSSNNNHQSHVSSKGREQPQGRDWKWPRVKQDQV
jgi:hypothetical protein